MVLDIKTLGLVISGGFFFIQWLSKRKIDTSKSNRESLTHLSELLNENLKDMCPQKKLLVEEALSGHYGRNIYINEILVLFNASSPKSAIENYLKYKRYLKIENGKVRYRRSPFTKIPFTNFNFPTIALKGIAMYVIFAFIGGSLLQNYIPDLLIFDYSQLINKPMHATSIISKLILVILGIISIIVAVIILIDSFLVPSKSVLENGLEGVFDEG